MNYTNIFRVDTSEKNLFGKMTTIYNAFDRDGNKVPAKIGKEEFIYDKVF